MLTQVSAATGPGLVVAGIVVLSVGLAPLFTLAADMAVGSAPPERAGAASGISETSSELGGALGLAILGTIGTAVYRSDAAAGLPDGAPAEAGDTIGGAVEAAAGLPQALAADVLEPAREAFAQGFQVAATVSGVLIVAAAVIVARLLRRPDAEAAEPVATAVAIEPCA